MPAIRRREMAPVFADEIKYLGPIERAQLRVLLGQQHSVSREEAAFFEGVPSSTFSVLKKHPAAWRGRGRCVGT